MKTTIHFYLVFILISCAYKSAFAQGFVQINAEQNGKQVTLSANQVLELRLPCNPSTGYAWYLRNNNNEIIRQADGIIEQTGNWEFIADRPMAGTPGQQIIRFIGIERGEADLHLAYMQPWSEAQPRQQYSLSVISEGAYTGTYKAPVPVAAKSEKINRSGSVPLPAKFSWLDEKIMTPITSSVCGSSWAFAACGQFEANIKRFDHVTRNLSEQWLINCDEDKYNCDGGMYPGNMFQKYGAVYEYDAPFKGTNGECKSPYPYHEKILGFVDIGATPTVAQLKEAIYTYGPVWAEVTAGNNFSTYMSGILIASDPGEVNHAIVLVGWNDSTESFVLRNSWGSAWGEQGYMRIKYGTNRVGEHAFGMIYKDPATSIQETADLKNAISIYPNPSVDDKLIIQLKQAGEANTQLAITIQDMQGRIVFKQDTKSDTTVEVNTHAFSKGVYVVTIASDTQSENYKIVK